MMRLRQRLLAQSWWVKGSILAVAVAAPVVAATAVVALSNGVGKDTEPDRSGVVDTAPVASRTPTLPSTTATLDAMPSETPLPTVVLTPGPPEVAQQPIQVEQTPIPSALASVPAPTPTPFDPLHRAPPAYWVHCTTAAACFVVGPNIYCEHHAKGWDSFTLECVSPATWLGLDITADWRLHCSGTWENSTGLDCQHTLDGRFSCGRSGFIGDTTTECGGDTWSGSCADSLSAISCYRNDSAGREQLDCTMAGDNGLWYPGLCSWANVLSFSCGHASGSFPVACRP